VGQLSQLVIRAHSKGVVSPSSRTIIFNTSPQAVYAADGSNQPNRLSHIWRNMSKHHPNATLRAPMSAAHWRHSADVSGLVAKEWT